REVQVVRVETGIDQRELLRLWIVDGKLTDAALERKDLGGRMRGSFATKRWIVRRTDARGEPHAAQFVEHRVWHVRLAVQDRFGSPVRRRQEHLRWAWRLWIAYRHLQRGRCVPHRVKNRDVVRARLWAAV